MFMPFTLCTGCKNFLGGDFYHRTCKAFPKGLPSEYHWGLVAVRKQKECNNGYRYEPEAHCLHCINYYNFRTNIKACMAFPEGIPHQYLDNLVDLDSLNECKNGYRYELYYWKSIWG